MKTSPTILVVLKTTKIVDSKLYPERETLAISQFKNRSSLVLAS